MKKNDELIVLEIMEQRGVLFNEAQKTRVHNLRQGYKGELEFKKWYDSHCNKRWIFVGDYWFEFKARMQADSILISPRQWILIDTKYYDAAFEYKNDVCYINNVAQEKNIFDSVKEKTRRLAGIAAKVDTRIQVRPVVVFIHENCHTTFDASLTVEAIQRTQLARFFNSIRVVDEMPDSLLQKVMSQLEFYRRPYGFPVDALKPEGFEYVRAGTRCGGCGGFNVEKNRSGLSCKKCGRHESLQEVVYKHAYELRYLFYHHPEMVTVNNLYRLMNGTISLKTIRKHMNTNFVLKRQSNIWYYEINI
ncbi:nuclease-related domain-containing protein [Fundicoccus culcitae]|uniref:NERD domain-containing protein n=1 Tax=Fundicoccus culcitae TaxID=2969821 RepID=A0ABY5P8M4_9LACT|nr:NERD domain-containing protein [Fundicoccus culcitae]UUX35111.1 NERD domain-containing protein [Fundicoccus culcitae]